MKTNYKLTPYGEYIRSQRNNMLSDEAKRKIREFKNYVLSLLF